MEFTKPSNVGPLIATALVGLLALCTDQAFMKPEDIDAFVRRFNRNEASQPETPQAKDAQLLLQQLHRGWQALTTASRSHRSGKPINVPALTKLMEPLGQACSDLCSLDAATANQKSEGQLHYFKSLFLAAEMAPKEFSDTFHQAGDALLEQAGLAQLRNVKLLLAFHRCSEGKLATDLSGLLSRLKAYSRQEVDHDLAIDLYALIADDLSSLGLLLPAKQVLEQGRSIYRRHPAKRKLNERLIDIKVQARR